MSPTITTPTLQAHLERGEFKAIRSALEPLHPAAIVNLVEAFETKDIVKILTSLPIRHQAEVFGYFPGDKQVEIAQAVRRGHLIAIITNMSHDERADLFAHLSPEQQEALLPGLAQAERDDICKLSSYPEGQAGASMTSDYATLPPHLTKEDAIAHLSKMAPETETIYQAFVIDDRRRLIGVVSLRDLILAKPQSRVEDLMKREPVRIHAHAPREEAVHLIAEFDLMVLPVVDEQEQLIGIITYDDAMDVAEAEGTEDFHTLAGVRSIRGHQTGHSLLAHKVKDAGIFMLYRMRIFWLVLLVFANIFSGAGIAHFEDTIATYVALVFFLPLLIDSGGNAGAQAATLMVRGLATGDVALRDWGHMIGKEVLVAGLLGITMALAVSVIGMFRGGPDIALVVSLSMIVIVLIGSLIGLTLPFILSRMKLDPAAASAPLVTSIADAAGVLIYFFIASTYLQPPPVG